MTLFFELNCFNVEDFIFESRDFSFFFSYVVFRLI